MLRLRGPGILRKTIAFPKAIEAHT